MKRRELLSLLAITGIQGLCGCAHAPLQRIFGLSNTEGPTGLEDVGEVSPTPQARKLASHEVTKDFVKDLRARSVHFDQDFPDDLYYADEKLEMLKKVTQKFRAVQNHVGHGNFNIIGMDEFFFHAERARGSSPVTDAEKQFLEEIFFVDAKEYGFQGEKVIHGFTDKVERSEVYKVPYTGHFLRVGKPLEYYQKIHKEVGESLILTSGYRGLAKQYHLFFEKTLMTGGNLSKASRSLAPPGYSYHGLADFDVGVKDAGLRNFTDAFALTDEYKRLIDLGYVEIRYPASNLLGVRFEPWHIKIRDGV